MTPMTWGVDKKAIVIVESELDGLLLQQEAGEMAGVIAMGSAQAKPDIETHRALEQAEIILVSLDSDDAGAKESWQFWNEHYKQIKRWPVPVGKDPGEARQQKLDIALWIKAGLDSHPAIAETEKPAISQPKQPQGASQTIKTIETEDSVIFYQDDSAHEQAPSDKPAIQTAKQKSLDGYELLLAMTERLRRYPACEGWVEHIKAKHPALWVEIQQAENACELSCNAQIVDRLKAAFRKAIETFYRDTAPEQCQGCWANAGKMCFRNIKVEQVQPETCLYIKPPASCSWCGSSDIWESRQGVKVCRNCHPPAPGAEAEMGTKINNKNM